jgi:hypothetical protein
LSPSIVRHDRRVLRLTDFIIDCPDTMQLAAFYSEVTGRPAKAGSDGEWAGIMFGEIELAFIRVEDYRAPQWPDSEHPKQFHLDFEVDDIEAEQNVHRPHRAPVLPLPQQERCLDRRGTHLAREGQVATGRTRLPRTRR